MCKQGFDVDWFPRPGCGIFPYKMRDNHTPFSISLFDSGFTVMLLLPISGEKWSVLYLSEIRDCVYGHIREEASFFGGGDTKASLGTLTTLGFTQFISVKFHPFLIGFVERGIVCRTMLKDISGCFQMIPVPTT